MAGILSTQITGDPRDWLRPAEGEGG